MMRWIERSPDLHEARATLADGREVYLGYVAMTTGATVWRGYVGRGFEPVGMGAIDLMRQAVERRALEAVKALEVTAGSLRPAGAGEEAHHAS